MDEKINRRHLVTITERERISVTGIIDVFSFDENNIDLETNKGCLDIKGEDLHVVKMNIDEGELIVEGMIKELIYHDASNPGGKKGNIISKLFK